MLLELLNRIEAGEHAWDEVHSLEPEWKSLPSGITNAWPDESPLTLHTLATLMISISDNTATDALIHILGHKAIEEFTPRNRPLLTTQELFKLKATPNTELLTRYRNGDEAEKRQVLEELAAVPLPNAQDMLMVPVLDIEWFFTAPELCELMEQVQEESLMTVSPGIARPDDWAQILT